MRDALPTTADKPVRFDYTLDSSKSRLSGVNKASRLTIQADSLLARGAVRPANHINL